MRSQFGLCVLSGMLGAGLMAWVLSGPAPVAQTAVGQEPGPRFPLERRAEPQAGRSPAARVPGDSSAADRIAEPVAPDSAGRGGPAAQSGQAGPPLAVGRTTLPLEDYTAEERVNIAVYDNCNRSVVHISTMVVNQGMMFFESAEEGEGSGSVLDKNGHILTNFHVVEGAREVEVTLFDGKSYPARLVGRDPSSDVAVLRINAPPESLFPIRFGDSSRLKVGQRVFALGNPFGLDRTLTTGIVSSLNRTLPVRNSRSIKSIIQIDAAINPGNSGGPLLDSHGRLIGMNYAIASRTGQNSGVGFAIPVGLIARVVPQLIQRGHVVRPDTGITRVFQSERGLLIATMTPGGPAEKAGLRGIRVVRQKRQKGPFVYDTETIDRSAADMIVAVDNQPVTTADEFLDLVESKRPGDDVTITVIRQGREQDVRLRLGAGES
jgi:S1-C subfamily serine protease